MVIHLSELYLIGQNIHFRTLVHLNSHLKTHAALLHQT